MKNKTSYNKRQKLVAFIAALLLCTGVSAQTKWDETTYPKGNPFYNTAIGLRGGQTSGLTLKHFTGNVSAVEAIIGFWPNAISVTGLFEHYVSVEPPGLHWYYGGGAHASFRTGAAYYTNEHVYYYRKGEIGLGIDGVLGIEYKIPPIPFALSIDIKPYLEATNMNRVNVALDPGIGIKVVF